MKKAALIGLLLTILASTLAGEAKFALAIGNGTYSLGGARKNAENNVYDMHIALESLGFTVRSITNGSLAQMESGIDWLKSRVASDPTSIGFFFFAGFGVQFNGDNYLVPVGAGIGSENALPRMAISMNKLLSDMQKAGNALNIAALDICQENPFRWTPSAKNLAPPPTGSNRILMYSPAAGSNASSNQFDRNSLFTKSLIDHLQTPGLSVAEVFRQTGDEVRLNSKGALNPRFYEQSAKTVYLNGLPGSGVAQRPPTPGGMILVHGGSYWMGSPPTETGRNGDETQHTEKLLSFYLGQYPVTVEEFRAFVNSRGYRTEAETKGGGWTWVATGAVQRPDATWKTPFFHQRDDSPVVQVSWIDAVNYCNWRSEREGLKPAYMIGENLVTWDTASKGYRLPTEAEWEYACRAGTETPFSTGNNITTNQANYDGKSPYNGNAKGAYREGASPVGTFPPNAWNLYDMHGNVWEWCWDIYSPTYEAVEDPEDLEAALRVRRGGGWNRPASELRSASRQSSPASYRGNFIGFRIARSL